MNYNEFSLIPSGTIFDYGVVKNSKDGILNESIESENIKWIAHKGYCNDFAIYYGTPEQTLNEISNTGFKLYDRAVIQRLLDCDDEVLNHYRM